MSCALVRGFSLVLFCCVTIKKNKLEAVCFSDGFKHVRKASRWCVDQILKHICSITQALVYIYCV